MIHTPHSNSQPPKTSKRQTNPPKIAPIVPVEASLMALGGFPTPQGPPGR